ncbi:MAG TPA: TIGR01777 family oxidoreductase [Gemmatimonadaceae bacterium]|nr:TIGR01777 family oxidoreductase [Gemmatimonadaceae bacterium]
MPPVPVVPSAARPRVAVTGVTGFIGARLLPELRARGYDVLTLSRRAGAAAPGGPGAADATAHWNPARGELDASALDGVVAAIHLAGENIGQRWTDARRRQILASRVQGTALLARTLGALRPRPRVLVSVSAVGYYGDGGDRELDETSPSGQGFLAEVVRQWEAAADPARDAGIRVVHPRLGVVLGVDGGALARLLPLFRLGLGGRLGDGRQWMSWLARDDAVRALAFLAEEPALAGAVNVVAPEPVRNAAFTRTLARVLHRPAPWVVPAFALELLYGQMARETLLWGQRVQSRRLPDAGFTFLQPTLEEALRAEIGGAVEGK